MTLAAFAGQDGKPIYINPDHVKAVMELNAKLCEVVLGGGHSIAIPLPVAIVAEDLQKASRLKP